MHFDASAKVRRGGLSDRRMRDVWQRENCLLQTYSKKYPVSPTGSLDRIFPEFAPVGTLPATSPQNPCVRSLQRALQATSLREPRHGINACGAKEEVTASPLDYSPSRALVAFVNKDTPAAQAQPSLSPALKAFFLKSHLTPPSGKIPGFDKVVCCRMRIRFPLFSKTELR
jgi:hypothetical protein